MKTLPWELEYINEFDFFPFPPIQPLIIKILYDELTLYLGLQIMK